MIERAQHRRSTSGERTIFFLDEIHRFNKAQQDTPPARGRGGARGAGGRHHREPLLRGQLGAALALPGVRAACARDRARAGAAAPLAGRRARRDGRPAGGRRRARVPRHARRRRRPHGAVRARAGLRHRGRRRRGHAPRGRGRAPAQRDPLRQGGRPPLRPDLGLDQVHARLRPGRLAALPRRDARGRRGPALRRAAHDRAGERGHRQRGPAGARGGGGHRRRRGARGHARGRAQPRPGRGVPGARAEVERLLQGPRPGARVGARARHPAPAGLPAERRLPGREEARPRPGLRLSRTTTRRACPTRS